MLPGARVEGNRDGENDSTETSLGRGPRPAGIVEFAKARLLSLHGTRRVDPFQCELRRHLHARDLE